jgi:hydrogenase-4 component B
MHNDGSPKRASLNFRQGIEDKEAVVQTLFWAGGALCLMATLLPLAGMFKPSRFVRQAALWLLLAGIGAVTADAVAASVRSLDLTFTLFHVTPQLALTFRLDRLSDFFIVIIGAVSFCSVIYSMTYIEHYEGGRPKQLLTSIMAFFILSMVLVAASGNTVGFLFFWELMSLSSFFLVMFELDKPETQKAGIFYFAMTQMGTIFLFVAFLLLYRFTGSFDISAAGAIPQWGKGLVFVSLFVGFGTKAGVIPFHKWLPYAHSASPSNVSALMSGVMLKVAIYGLARFIIDVFQPDLWWGILLLVFGSISAVLGVIYALKEHDIKKLLAYHSIENIGIIVLGLGLYIIFKVNGSDVLADLALFGALFHTLNHALFKSLLFMTAGSVAQVTGTRNIEKMGGLVKAMPWTASLFLLGACSISALPPLNGFASEIMIFQAYLGSFALNRPLLEVLLITGLAVFALTSALAAACFAKAFGIVFLARPRSEAAKNAREVPFAQLLAPGILGALCAGLGIFSFQIVSLVRPDLPIPNMLPVGAILLVVTALAVLLLRLNKSPVRKTETWGCGIPEQTGHMEYTAGGFSEPIVTVFKSIFRTRKISHREFSDKFNSIPSSSSGEIITLKFFEERIYLPLVRFFMGIASAISNLHNTDLDALILYSFVAIVIVILGVGWWL